MHADRAAVSHRRLQQRSTATRDPPQRCAHLPQLAPGGADFRHAAKARASTSRRRPQIVAQARAGAAHRRRRTHGSVAGARQEIKGEFRLQQTTFRRAKTTAQVFRQCRSALHNLLVKRNAAYLDTPAAFEDAFVDVRHTRCACLARMRAAFDFMLTRFDPEALARQFDARPGRKLSIGLGAGGRHWDSFGEYYKEMTRDADDCFRRLFGDQFARAYEEQLQRLRAESRSGQCGSDRRARSGPARKASREELGRARLHHA
jgi:type VI secretion system FHA domain protein